MIKKTFFIILVSALIWAVIVHQELYPLSDKAENIRQHAREGSPSNQYALALMYKTGKGAKKNDDEFIYWLNKSAEQGNEEAQLRLAAEYLHGPHKNNEEGIKLLRKAAKEGSVKAQHLLALAYYYGENVSKDYKQAFEYFKKAAEQNELDSVFYTGICYEKGKGVSKDKVESYKWFLRAAEEGHIEAQKIIASKYSIGDTLPQNPTLAFKWYKKAADSGDSMSQDIIGRMYSTGDGIDKNTSLAHEYFRKAAKQGYVEAEADLARLYYQEKKFKESYKFANNAAHNGSAYAQELLGVLYINGTGVPKNKIEGYFWLTHALKNNSTSSKIKEDLNHLEKELSQEELNKASVLLKERSFAPSADSKK